MSSAPQRVLGAASVTGAGHPLGRGSDTLIQLLLPKSLWGSTRCSGNRRLCCSRPVPALALPPTALWLGSVTSPAAQPKGSVCCDFLALERVEGHGQRPAS